MKLHQLPKNIRRKKKRLGRGYGSGKGGHTASRGQKGQKSRSKIPIWFEGGQLPFIRRLPFIKGKSRFKSLNNTVALNVRDLEIFKTNQKVDVDALLKAGLISKNDFKSTIKILGRGKLTKSLKVLLPVSKQAEEKIKKAGGTIELPKSPPKK
ncbi:50S ribosomal protein L15 [Patescibacteria group bacterium]